MILRAVECEKRYLKTMDKRPIGFFDSGMGGASVLRVAIRMLQNENFIYYGDNGNAPYGDRSEAEILALTSSAADFLLEHGVKALVIACNTATSASINVLRDKLDVPVISMEPAIKPACMCDGDGKVFMLATEATTHIRRYRALLERMPDPSRVISIGCSGLVDRIERGIVEDNAFDDILDEHLSKYHGIKADAVVLGCTHYPFIASAIDCYFEKHFSGEHRLYDGSMGTVSQLNRVLKRSGLENDSGTAQVEFFTSGDAESLRPIFKRFLTMPPYENK